MAQKNYFNISERKILLKIIDVLLILLSLFLSFKIIKFSYLNFNNPEIYKWLILISFYYLIFGEIFQLFNLNVSNNRYLVVRSIVVTTFITTIIYIFTPYISPVLPNNRLQIVYLFFILTIPLIIWRFLYIQVIFSPKYFKTVIFVGNSDRIEKMLRQINNDNLHSIRGYFSDKKIKGIDGFNDISKVKLSDFNFDESINELVVSKEDLLKEQINTLNKDLIFLFEKGVNIVSFAKFYQSVTARIPREYLQTDFYEHIHFSKNNTNRFYLFGLRFLDILVSIFGLLLLTILIPFLLTGNLFANRGTLFYHQKRVGQNGKLFNIFKLRTMVKNAESGGAVWAQKNDSRITKFGKFLRNTRLDEMPQFYNILKGDMSIIGPRPERPEFVKELEEKIPFYAIRNIVRPGLTGWAQVNYPYANTIEEQETKLRYDLYYIKERSSFLDFKILIKTVTTVLFFRGQ